MSKLCSCICSCFCNCIKCIAKFVLNYFISFTYVSLCCCLFGMLLMAGILLAYYGSFYSTTPSAALEHTGMYDYVHESPMLKRDVGREAMDFEDDDYENEADGGKEVMRREVSATKDDHDYGPDGGKEVMRREVSATTSSSRSPTTSRRRPNATAKTSAEMNDTADPSVFLPDLTHANALLDSVFAGADASNLTQSLGLCRKSADFAAADYRPPPFAAGAAADVLTCVNDLVAAQSRRTLCVHLDAEANEYLKWLILTGEPKERFRQAKAGYVDDFLFPATCQETSPPNETSQET